MGSCVSKTSADQEENSLTLPTEIWMKILMYLKYTDLSRVAMVNRFLYKIASDHTLWPGSSVKNMRKFRNENIAALFSVPRFNQIKCLDMSNANMLSQQWSNTLEFLKTTRMEEFTVCYVDLSKVCGDSLANCVSHLKKVNLEGSSISILQVKQMLVAISESAVLEDLNLLDIYITDELGCSDKTEIARMMTRAICKLRSINISYTLPQQLLNRNRLSNFYTQETLTEFFQSCLQSSTLKELYFPLSIHVSEVPSDLFSQVICHLDKVNISTDFIIQPDANITSLHFQAILKQNLDRSILKELTLSPIVLNEEASELSPSLLIHSISKLEKISLPGCSLSDVQAEALFSAPIHSNTLWAMNLAFCNLSNIHNIPQSTHHLQRLDLQNTQLSSAQTTAILTESLNSSTLKELSLWNVEVSQVPQDLLSQALCRLKKVRLGCHGRYPNGQLAQGGVTLEQCNYFLEYTLSSTTLEDVTFFSESIGEVSPNLIGKVVGQLQRTNLEFNELTKEQIHSILAHSTYSQSIVEVRLSHTNFHTLQNIPIHPKEILMGAKKIFCTSRLQNQKVEKGRDWGRGPYDITNAIPCHETGGSVGVVSSTKIEFSNKGDYWSQQAKGIITVEWNNGNFSLCRMGRGDCYDVKLSPYYGNLEWLYF